MGFTLGMREEEYRLVPDFWLYTRALEQWLHEKSREGWSLKKFGNAPSITLVRDNAHERYRVVAWRPRFRKRDFDGESAAFLEARRREGWEVLKARKGVFIFVDRKGTARNFADEVTAATVRRRLPWHMVRNALPWLAFAAALLILHLRSDIFLYEWTSIFPLLIVGLVLLCGLVNAFCALARGLSGLYGAPERGKKALFYRWQRSPEVWTSAGMFVSFIVLVLMDTMHMLPNPWQGAALTAAEAPLRLEAVYGSTEGAFASEAQEGSFFVPRIARCHEESGAHSLSAQIYDCRWEWVAERVYEQERAFAAFYGGVDAEAETLEALGLDALFCREARDGDTSSVCFRDGSRVALLSLSPAADFETVCAALLEGTADCEMVRKNVFFFAGILS